MSNSAPLQRLLVWLRRHKEVHVSCNLHIACLTRHVQDSQSAAAALGTEQNDREFSTNASADKSEWCRPQNTPLDRSVSNSTGRYSKISGRSWSTGRWSDDHASDIKRHSRSHRLSLFSSHNPDEEFENISRTTSSTTTRPASYVPRHASSSHLRTTTPRSPCGQAIKNHRASQVY